MKHYIGVKKSETALHIHLKYIKLKEQGAKSMHLFNKNEDYLHIYSHLHTLSQEAYTRKQW